MKSEIILSTLQNLVTALNSSPTSLSLEQKTALDIAEELILQTAFTPPMQDGISVVVQTQVLFRQFNGQSFPTISTTTVISQQQWENTPDQTAILRTCMDKCNWEIIQHTTK